MFRNDIEKIIELPLYSSQQYVQLTCDTKHIFLLVHFSVTTSKIMLYYNKITLGPSKKHISCTNTLVSKNKTKHASKHFTTEEQALIIYLIPYNEVYFVFI